MSSDEDLPPSTVRWEDFINAPEDALANQTPPTPPAKSIAERIDDERLEELKEARVYRRRIVWFTLTVVGTLVAAATTFTSLYFWSEWGELDPAVMIAYFTSVVVESIGILYVIASYLFPKDGPKRQGEAAAEE